MHEEPDSVSYRNRVRAAVERVQIEEAFEQYRREVRISSLSEETKGVYLDHARRFICWLYGDDGPSVEVDA